ncbi:MAG: hypothetical protein ACKESB_01390 [Candidatus Hodgkinia cicadicola]
MWRSNCRWYAQVTDYESRAVVVAAAHSPQRQFSGLVRKLAARCLAAGVFEALFVSKYKGGVVQVVNGLRLLGIVI